MAQENEKNGPQNGMLALLRPFQAWGHFHFLSHFPEPFALGPFHVLYMAAAIANLSLIFPSFFFLCEIAPELPGCGFRIFRS